MVRVAVLQIENQLDSDRAISSCTLLIDRAVVEQSAQIVVFPELRGHADDESAHEGRLAQALSVCAERHAIWIFGSLERGGVTNCLWVDPSGQIGVRPASDLEQTGDGEFDAESALIATPHGTVGLCAGRAALGYEVTRRLTGAGAQLVCASLCHGASPAPSPSSTQPQDGRVCLAVSASSAPAPEPYPPHLDTLPPHPEGPAVALAHSQIVGPEERLRDLTACADGAFLVARVELTELVSASAVPEDARDEALGAGPSSGATHEAESPAAPAPATEAQPQRREPRAGDRRPHADGALSVAALAIGFEGSSEQTVERACEAVRALAREGVSLIVLPELFCFEPSLSDPEAAADQFVDIVRALAVATRRTGTHVATSLVERAHHQLFHMGVLIGQGGVVFRQPQLHTGHRRRWAEPGGHVQTARLPWGKLALCLGEDALVPELSDTLRHGGAEVVAVPLSARCASLAELTLTAAAQRGHYAVVGAVASSRRTPPWDEAQTEHGSDLVDPDASAPNAHDEATLTLADGVPDAAAEPPDVSWQAASGKGAEHDAQLTEPDGQREETRQPELRGDETEHASRDDETHDDAPHEPPTRDDESQGEQTYAGASLADLTLDDDALDEDFMEDDALGEERDDEHDGGDQAEHIAASSFVIDPGQRALSEETGAARATGSVEPEVTRAMLDLARLRSERLRSQREDRLEAVREPTPGPGLALG
jgi:deaminated glutathione amidase